MGIATGVILMLVLIPMWEVLGAALALCLGSGTGFILNWYYTEKHYPIGFPKLFSLLIVILMFLVVVLSNFFTIPLSIKSAVTILFFLILVLYRDVIKKIINVPLSS